MAYQTTNTPADPKHSSRLGLRQRFYVVEVLVGLALTAQHFFANLGRHTLKGGFRGKGGRGAGGSGADRPALLCQPRAAYLEGGLSRQERARGGHHPVPRGAQALLGT